MNAALEALVKATGGEVVAACPGSGAAGGLGFGLRVVSRVVITAESW
jgi:glycerate kinase